MDVTTAKQVIAEMDKGMIANVAGYIRHLESEGVPIVSRSHLLLRDLYQRYGKEAVDTEVDRQFACRAEHDAKVTCGACGETWCETCDPAPSALCHKCHGRGYTKAPAGNVDWSAFMKPIPR